MELDFDLIDAAAKEHIREQDLAGYSVGLETFQLMMGAFRAGVAWATTNFEYNKNHTDKQYDENHTDKKRRTNTLGVNVGESRVAPVVTDTGGNRDFRKQKHIP